MTINRADVARILKRMTAMSALLIVVLLPIRCGLFSCNGLCDSLRTAASLRGVATVGMVAALGGLLLGALICVPMQIFPLQALRRVADMRFAEKRKSDLLLETLQHREVALQESEARFRALHDASFGGILIHEHGRIIDCNQGMADLIGCTVDELIGIDGMRFIAPEWQDVVRQRTSTGYSGMYEIEGVRCDGSRCPVSVQGKRIPYKGRSVRVTEFRDISERRRSIEALRASEENLAITLNSIGDAVIATDAQGLVTRMNPTAERLTGWTFAEARGRPITEIFVIVNAQTRAPVVSPVQLVMECGQIVGLADPTVLLARGGEAYHIADSAAPIRNSTGEIIGVVLVVSDVTEKYRTEATLHETQAILAAAMDQTPVGIAIAEAPDGLIRYVNDAGLALRGLERRHFVIGRRIDEHYAGFAFYDRDERPLGARDLPLSRAVFFGETATREFVVRDLDGRASTYVSRAAPIRDAHGKVVAAIAVFIDITEKKIAEDEIRRLAFYDQLTGLPNRRLLLDRLTQALATQSRNRRGGALLFVDLDNFKTINDTLGHDLGDELLKQVAERLKSKVRAGDTVARIGGDEFVVLLDALSPLAEEAARQAENVGEKILERLAQDYRFDQQTQRSSASVGIALFEPGIDVDELFKRADLAMYQAKNAGRNTLCFFDPKMQAMVRTRLALEAGLREAIDGERFFLLYQPQVDAAGTVFGAEALLRWRRSDGIVVTPGEFIALAEESGLILAIDAWVVDAACRQLVAWAQGAQTEALTLAINVSARQFHHPDFVAQLTSALARSGANPRRLKIEITESQLIEDIDSVIAKMSALRAAGVCLSLDDFGTGYSSLAYLKRLPLDQLKIDRSFVRDLLSDATDAAIVRTIITLGNSLGLSVIAEGVESKEQKTRLAELGCLCYQGFLFGRPQGIEQFEEGLLSGPVG